MTTIQKLHKTIRDNVGVLSSKYSPSQRIDRTTYDIVEFKGYFGVCSSKHIEEIKVAIQNTGARFDDSTIERGFIKVFKS